MTLLITTVRAPDARLVKRAKTIAAKLDVAYHPRGELPALQTIVAEHGVYVVGHRREEVVTAHGTCFVQPGLFRMKVQQGDAHPLIRAISSSRSADLHILDCTLGLANDALHLSAVLGASVWGLEKSPLIECLLREGLPRMQQEGRAWSDAATRVRLVGDDAKAYLAMAPTSSFDVVYFDPMMRHPKRATPSLNALRDAGLGCSEPLGEDVLAEAARVARARVVVKQARGSPAPPFRIDHTYAGTDLTYYCHESR